MRYLVLALVLGAALLTPVVMAKDWQTLFDGKTLTGWRRMAVHGGNGGVWTVEKGAIVGNQEPDHKGGLLGTERKFSDYELQLEFQADFPVDTGLFLRVRDDGMGYQVTIDYREKGSIGSIYAPAEGGFLKENSGWEPLFKKGEWNKFRVRIEGEPAHIQAWLNDKPLVDFTDTKARYPREGYIGLQVHGGAGAWGENSRVRYRNIRIQELNKK